jgi:DNA-binding NarL/FixJ family response regulator
MGPHLQLAATGRSEAPIRVALVEQNPVVRHYLSALLIADGDILVVADAPAVEDLVDELDRWRPDVLVVPLRSRAASSIEALRTLCSSAPGAEVVVMTMENHAALAQRAIDAGAAEVVLKERAPGDLPAAVRRAAGIRLGTSAPIPAGWRQP